jgi:TPR repeat protein
MTKCHLNSLLLLLLCASGENRNFGQDSLRGITAMAISDVSAIKQQAEAGDAKAQVALADALSSSFRMAESLQWYGKAATQGNLEAVYQVGRLLLFGAAGIPKDQTVPASPTDGIRWTYMASHPDTKDGGH